jgi:hypothetical protein
MSIEPAGVDLDRVRDLCADLAGAVDGELLAWAGPGDVDAVAAEVFGVVTDAGLLADADPRHPVSIPADGEALMSRMWELDEPAAIELLVSLSDRQPDKWSRDRLMSPRYPDSPARS